MNYTQIKVEKKDQVYWISLNRPEKLNALTPTMLSEWCAALTKIEADKEARLIVVKGEGKAWSAGVDLAVFQEAKVEPGFRMFEDGVEIMRLLENMPQVTIAMVHGYCFTGALELLMAFDLIVAAEEAKLGDTHAKWGIPPKWGMTQRLAHQVGMRKAKELSFTARFFSGKEAEEMGLVNRAVPLASLEEEVQQLIDQVLENSGQTIAAVKHLYQYGSTHSLEEGLKYEAGFEVKLTDKEEDLKNFKDRL